MHSTKITGFCFPYSIRPSPGKGHGVFIDAVVPKGTVLWRPKRGLYKVFDEDSFKAYLARLSVTEVVYELEHVFSVPEFPDYLIKIIDGGELINHSLEPNTAMKKDIDEEVTPYNNSPLNLKVVRQALMDDRFTLIATQGLSKGEELTMNYKIGLADPEYYDALCVQYEVTWPWLQL